MRHDNMTTNFKRREFACKGASCCGGASPISPLLVALLQSVRSRVGWPVTVTSGFRCVTHNRRIPGAVDGSYHTLGWAADITCPRIRSTELYTACLQEIAEAGYGYAIHYPEKNIVHMDIRNYF